MKQRELTIRQVYGSAESELSTSRQNYAVCLLHIIQELQVQSLHVIAIPKIIGKDKAFAYFKELANSVGILSYLVYKAVAVNNKPRDKKPPLKPETINEEETSITVYKPNRLIKSVIEEAWKEYQLPSGSVDMLVQETGAIAAVILYLIKAEPKIEITKLEYYIILLDKMCYQETGQKLFNYRLTYDRTV